VCNNLITILNCNFMCVKRLRNIVPDMSPHAVADATHKVGDVIGKFWNLPERLCFCILRALRQAWLGSGHVTSVRQATPCATQVKSVLCYNRHNYTIFCKGDSQVCFQQGI
jgi:hypothetical protein